jgi:hypothetical protein
MTNATLTPAPVETATNTDSDFLAILAGGERPEYAPGRVNGGRQASFDTVAAWNAVGRID